MLTPDPELQAVGSEMKIPYEGDYNFYLERLHKRFTWAIETMNFFNIDVFGTNKMHKESSKSTMSSTPLCTWEDSFLDNLANDTNGPPAQNTTGASVDSNNFHNINSSESVPGLSPPGSPHHLSLHSPPPRPGLGSPSHSDLPRLSHLPLNQISHPANNSLESPSKVATSSAMVSIHNYPGATVSAVSWLQVEVGQMSISGTQSTWAGPSAQTSSTRRVSSCCPAPVPAQLPESSMLPTNSGPPSVQKHVTCARTKAQK